MLSNNNFNSIVDSFVSDKSKIQSEIKHAEAELDKLRKKLEEHCCKREVVVRYIPNEPLTAEIVKGAEFIEPNKPDNVVALIDAAAKLMADSEGVSRASLAEAMLNALMNAMKIEIFSKHYYLKGADLQ